MTEKNKTSVLPDLSKITPNFSSSVSSRYRPMRRWQTIGGFECDRVKEEEENVTISETEVHEHSLRISEVGKVCPHLGLSESDLTNNINVKNNDLDNVEAFGSRKNVSEVDQTENVCESEETNDSEASLKDGISSDSGCKKDDSENSDKSDKPDTVDSDDSKRVDDDDIESDRESDTSSLIKVKSQAAERKDLGKWRFLEKLIKRRKDTTSQEDQEKKNDDENGRGSDVGNCDEEDMDAELPRTENITSFYDLVRAVKNSNENLSAQEIENKFKQISLAFKTDRITLKQRLEVQQRQRDIAEANFERELKLLECSILALHEDCINMELVDAIMQIRKHLDVLTISSTSLLSASEVWGAVQQEWRVSRALEVLLLHVENVKRLYENDHQELEEMRRILNEHQIEYPANPGGGGSGQSTTTDSALGSIRIRALSLAGVSKQQSQESGNRRISLGPNASRNLRDFLGGRGSKRRASLMPDLGLFHQEIAAAAVAAAASKASKEKSEEKRHSTNGMLGNSITEEGSESGDEASGNTRPATGDSSPTSTAGSKVNFPFDTFTQALQDSDQRSNEDGSSSFHTPPTDTLASSNLSTGFNYHPQHWAMHGFEDFIGWLRGGHWPFSSQQTYQGVRYLFTSFLLLLAVLFLLLTISSGDEAQQPCHPGWTTIHHLLHPYVAIRHTGPAEY